MTPVFTLLLDAVLKYIENHPQVIEELINEGVTLLIQALRAKQVAAASLASPVAGAMPAGPRPTNG